MTTSIRFMCQEEEVHTLNNDIPIILPQKGQNQIQNLIEYCAQNKGFVLEQVRDYGAILMRGFDVREEKGYHDVLVALGLETAPNLLDPQGRTTYIITSFLLPKYQRI